VPELLERHGLGEEVLIEKYLLPLLDANETKFFPTGIKRNGKTVYQVDVQALGIRHAALRTAFELHGSYAPRDPKEAAQYGVKIIRVDIPRPPDEFNQFVDVIPESALSRHGVAPVTPPTNGTNGTPHKNGNAPAKPNGKPPTNGDASCCNALKHYLCWRFLGGIWYGLAVGGFRRREAVVRLLKHWAGNFAG
jgi:hypothetical protein